MDTLDFLHISLADQMLYGFSGERLVLRMSVSTAANGAGERNGSGCTPRGLHQVRAKIGAGLPSGAVLRGRRWTGEVWTPELHQAFPGRDWILTRILWLSGREPGRNRLGDVDTFRRYIYLHGTPDSEPMGVPGSHGCVRMRNDDLLELFPRVPLHCPVRIEEAPCPEWRATDID
ncbi:L,D-transpeptidase catalytic domain [compost metagenome]|uniref:L,D-transpeptidase catalytic domain n=1 Tax=Pseudomonas jinjuensis TaxID=198616 RepID=A0A1H0AJ09_9PSED|nr:L,D-transpeptidase [Pseudomonas jinjuensis]SDN33572.1 L,D-transpeptidase catalytic domain [Pseudomonas jinjuensis]